MIYLKGMTQPHRDHNGFALHDAVCVLDTLAWRIHRGEIVSAERQGQYLVRLADGRERYFQPAQIRLVENVPQATLF